MKKNKKKARGHILIKGHTSQKEYAKMNIIHDKAKAILEVSKQSGNSNEYLLALLIAEIENLTTVIKYKPQ